HSEDYTAVEKRDLVFFDQFLWKPGYVYLPPGPHVLPSPFRFRLPSGIPPSVARNEVAISYSAEATGLRLTSFFANSRKICESLAVVPRAIPVCVRPS
ncbi:hypothetical protein LXA43DRAFT_875333, partial [Ganoderma leucocontextum]